MKDPERPLTLVADIGGTNTRIALARGTQVDKTTARRYPNADHPDLAAVVRRFLEECGEPAPEAACIAVAGPVRDGRAALTNLDWVIDEETLARCAGTDVVAILNDLQAQGYALGHTEPGLTRSIIAGPRAGRGAAQLVVNLGTGFNIAPVYEVGGRRIVPPAEAGHATLPVRDERDLRLARFVARTHGFASVEEVLSGRGIEHVDAWLAEEEGRPAERDSTEIMSALAAGRDGRARQAGEVFVRILGTVCGDLALATLPRGGIWLVGGLARAFGPYLEALGFAAAFRDKGRFSAFMEQFPVDVVEDDWAALTGCAAHLAERARHRA
ncbi:glucokinase [Rubellimicrobium sp. CFH 75288]|uniref:glucokinase n=1 Tax=Rubellimicrobium sp. CFH 75288 TaxID=2697034 RepID=UPI0014132F04|nr:glucokinase [Rubellimicrobium sp. CFH 75288]NAZ35290.1 glucokinase [Rubellimicrobium sp. CFH 75288]